VVKALRY